MVPHSIHIVYTYTVEIKEYDNRAHVGSMVVLRKTYVDE